MDLADLRKKISPKLIDEIQQLEDRMIQLSFTDGYPQQGIIIQDTHGMVLLAKDDDTDPFVTFLSIPIPLSLESALHMRNLWLEYKCKLDIDSPARGNFLTSSIDILFAEINNPLAIANLSTLLGCFLVGDLHQQGTSLKSQVTHNKKYISQKLLETHFVIVTLSKTILKFSVDLTSRFSREGNR